MPRFPLDRRERPEPGNSCDVLQMARNNGLNSYRHGMPMNRAPLSEVFAQQQCRIVFDDFEICYAFHDIGALSWRHKDAELWEDESYECYASSAENLYFLFHETKNAIPPACRAFAIDLADNRITMLDCVVGGCEDNLNSDMDICPHFGYIDFYDGREPPRSRHHYTAEMVRKVVMWRVNTWCLIHYYTSKQYFTNQVMIGQDGLVASEPARHIKLRDNVYLFHWREMTAGGGMGADIMDFCSFRGVGMFYGVGGGGKCINGFQREDCNLLTHEDLLRFEQVFEERGERAAMEAMGVDLSEKTVDLIFV
jgi:hypothetical protein